MKPLELVAISALFIIGMANRPCAAQNMVLRLDGDPESYFAAPDSDSLDLDLGTEFTVEAWVNPDTTTGENMILNKEDVYEIAVNNGFFQTAIQPEGQGWGWLDSQGEVLAGEWTHVAITWDGETVNTFVNGEFMLSHVLVADQLNDSDDTFKVGRRTRGGDTHSIYTGFIDEVRISSNLRYTEDGFDVPRNAFVSDEHTVALYHFDSVIGGQVPDASGRGNDGMLINDATLVIDNFLLAPGQGSTPGDFNEDGVVDLLDFTILASNFNTRPAAFGSGDINFDNRVDLRDFIQFRQVFHSASGVAAVPEPEGLLMAAVLALACMRIPARFTPRPHLP